jgi:hypothetical protein
MKKKLVIIVTIAFFLSTVGLPISLHLCNITETASLSICEICAADKIEKAMPCCKNGEDEYPVKLTSGNSNQCCDTKIIDNSISDNFISFKLELKQEHSSTVVYITDLISKQLRLNSQFINETASPPSAQHNDLYLQNSVLLI